MYICERCGKGIMRGNAVSHAKNRTKRIFLPNLHMVKALINGQPKIIRVCTKCLRRVVKAPKRDLSKVISDTQKTQKTQKTRESEKLETPEVQKEETKKAPKNPPTLKLPSTLLGTSRKGKRGRPKNE